MEMVNSIALGTGPTVPGLFMGGIKAPQLDEDRGRWNVKVGPSHCEKLMFKNKPLLFCAGVAKRAGSPVSLSSEEFFLEQ